MIQADILNKNIAVIDLGSNSVRLQIATAYEKSYKIVSEYKEIIRIGDDLFKNDRLTEESINKIFKTFSYIRTLLDSYNVVYVKAVATATLRSAPNGTEIVESIREDWNRSGNYRWQYGSTAIFSGYKEFF